MIRITIKGGNLYTERCIEGRQCEKTREKDSHLKAKDRGLGLILP